LLSQASSFFTILLNQAIAKSGNERFRKEKTKATMKKFSILVPFQFLQLQLS
jgi:hypothetical protein